MRLGSSLGSLCEQIRINVKFFLFLKNYTWLYLWLSMGNFSVCNEGNINQYSNLLFRVLAAKYRLWSNRAWVLKSRRIGQLDLMYFHAGNGCVLCAHCRNYIWHALNRIVRCHLKQASDWICIRVSWHMRCYPLPPKFDDCQTALYCTIIFFVEVKLYSEEWCLLDEGTMQSGVNVPLCQRNVQSFSG